MASLRFLGGAGTVTGSRFLVEAGPTRILVDCGLYQGLKGLRLRNWEPFPLRPTDLDAVVVTHAHLDHTGWLPVLVRDGFAGPIVATPDTGALAAILLPDSGRLQEEQARDANRHGWSRHHPARPLYTEDDARRAADRFRPQAFGTPVDLPGDVRVTLAPAGHILGSATVTLDVPGAGPIVFSGDLGRPDHPILAPPQPIARATTVVVESTYGDRQHDDAHAEAAVFAAVARTAARSGTVVIPAFAVDRTEVVLRLLARGMRAGAIPSLPVYVDSPMALRARGVYRRAIDEGAPDVRPGAGHALAEPPDVREVHDVEASKALNDLSGPAIIVSASGMATGGRVLHHLVRRLGDERHSVVLVGYQAAGTRGRRLLAGEPELKLLGRRVPVRAEVVDATGISVHADRDELVAWIASAPDGLDHVHVVHGEPGPAGALATAVRERVGVPASVAVLDSTVGLAASGPGRRRPPGVSQI